MNIIEAAQAMKEGKRVKRPGWKKGEFIKRYYSNIEDQNYEEPLFWLEDILATDWEIVE